jgi:erythromycin esterase-like protein
MDFAVAESYQRGMHGLMRIAIVALQEIHALRKASAPKARMLVKAHGVHLHANESAVVEVNCAGQWWRQRPIVCV